MCKRAWCADTYALDLLEIKIRKLLALFFKMSAFSMEIVLIVSRKNTLLLGILKDIEMVVEEHWNREKLYVNKVSDRREKETTIEVCFRKRCLP